MIFDDCTIYDDCEPAGVELPKTVVKSSKLKEIGLSSDSSTKEILYELARKGLKEKGITKPFNNNFHYWKYEPLNEAKRIAGILNPLILK